MNCTDRIESSNICKNSIQRQLERQHVKIPVRQRRRYFGRQRSHRLVSSLWKTLRLISQLFKTTLTMRLRSTLVLPLIYKAPLTEGNKKLGKSF